MVENLDYLRQDKEPLIEPEWAADPAGAAGREGEDASLLGRKSWCMISP